MKELAVKVIDAAIERLRTKGWVPYGSWPAGELKDADCPLCLGQTLGSLMYDSVPSEVFAVIWRAITADPAVVESVASLHLRPCVPAVYWNDQQTSVDPVIELLQRVRSKFE